MSTVQETLLPAAMVPGLVTVEDKDGNRKNVYPIDAKDLIYSGEYTLVENGAIEAARMAATPLRSGYASGIPSDQIIAEVAGVEGRIIAASTPEEAEEIKEAGDSPDANREPAPGPGVGYEAMRDAHAKEYDDMRAAVDSANKPKAPGKGSAQQPAPRPPAPSGAADKKDDK